MTPSVDKDPEKRHKAEDLPEDLRQDWEQQDIETANRKPDLGEIEEDTDELES